MNKSINLKSKELKDELVKNINSSELPPVLIKYLLKDLLQEVETIEINSIKQELEQIKEKESDKNDKV